MPLGHRSRNSPSNPLAASRTTPSPLRDYIYEIPRMLAKAVTGFDYNDEGSEEWESLERIKKWWFF
ncbi:MAG: hypothetical protein FWD53_03875 [Phycisphaerales bacterium]|nr:hypothetical protein [Phycisphaerales bacterium]